MTSAMSSTFPMQHSLNEPPENIVSLFHTLQHSKKRYFDINMREKAAEMGTAIYADESYNQIQPYMI